MSLDAYRGFIMLLMASSGLYLWKVAQSIPHSDPLYPVWRFLAFHTDHVAWVGGGFWDMIQPSFMFMVGVAMPYSYASRKAKGMSERAIWFHAVWRALLLVVLAVFLSSPLTHAYATASRRSARVRRDSDRVLPSETHFVFVNVLAQIGLGYVFVFLLRGRGLWVQLGRSGGGPDRFVAAVLSVPAAGGRTSIIAAVGLPTDWQHPQGWFAHWDKNTNAAAAFDVWFLNLFPRRVRRFSLTRAATRR